jgi:hypothetical protein
MLSSAGKAGGFAEMGYTAETLKPELETIGKTITAADASVVTEFGQKFEKAAEVLGPANTMGRINTIWQIDHGSSILRVISAWVEVFK